MLVLDAVGRPSSSSEERLCRQFFDVDHALGIPLATGDPARRGNRWHAAGGVGDALAVRLVASSWSATL